MRTGPGLPRVARAEDGARTPPSTPDRIRDTRRFEARHRDVRLFFTRRAIDSRAMNRRCAIGSVAMWNIMFQYGP